MVQAALQSVADAAKANRSLEEHLAKHSDYVKLHFRSSAVYVFHLAVFLAVWFADFIVLSATFEYFAGRVLHPWVVPIVCVFSPLVLITIEANVGLQRELAIEDGARVRAWSWLAIGLAVALIAPLAAMATTTALQPSTSNPDAANALQMQAWCFALLAFGGHLAILFGGRHAHDAKAFTAFKIRQILLGKKVERLERRSKRAGGAAMQAFWAYNEARELHNAEFPDTPIRFGPFDAETRRLLNDRLGYECLFVQYDRDWARPDRREAQRRSNGGSSATTSPKRPGVPTGERRNSGPGAPLPPRKNKGRRRRHAQSSRGWQSAPTA
jgi:hypothetical protein